MKRKGTKNIPWNIVEGVLVVCLLAGGLAFRIYRLQFVREEASVYYEAARVAAGNSLPPLSGGMLPAYLWLLRGVFLVFGNHWILGIWLQIVLQLVTGVLLYAAVRRILKWVTAAAALAVYLFLPASVAMGFSYSPDVLSLCLMLFVLFLAEQIIAFGVGLVRSGSGKAHKEMSAKVHTEAPEKEMPAMEEKKETVSGAPSEEKAAPEHLEFIKNPLPLPKQHVRKAMEYAVEPDEAHMKYDIEVDEKDDFDY